MPCRGDDLKIWYRWWGPLSDEQGGETVERAVKGLDVGCNYWAGRAYFIWINWVGREQEIELDAGDARDQREARPLVEDLAQERLAGTGRAHSRLGYRRLATFLITSQPRESLWTLVGLLIPV